MSTENQNLILCAARPENVLPAGIQTLLVHQKIVHGQGEAVYQQEIDIEVRLERFTPPEIAFRYPQPGSRASFSNVIPHLVLSKAVLPWERSASVSKRIPWLMLIAFAGESRPKKIHFAEISELGKGPNAELGKAVLDAYLPTEPAQLKDKCRFIDVDLPVFKALAPTAEDLESLAHIQQAAIREDVHVLGARKELDDAERSRNPEKTAAARKKLEAAETNARKSPTSSPEPTPVGAPAAVLLNRYCVEEVIAACGEPADKEVPVEVHLVSVEGMEPLLAEKKQAVRLLSLDHWSFIHDGKRAAGFEARCKGLKETTLGSYVSFTGAPESLQYRGPLLSYPNVAPRPKSWDDPDQCLFESETGRGVDISFAAAWQLGRLVALGDPDLGGEFARLRARWRYEAAARKGNVLSKAPPAGTTAPTEVKSVAAERLRRLWLLERVPLHYLVAAPEMLPPESICVVHVDPMWTDAWCGGAFSVGSLAAADYTLESPEATGLLKESGLAEWRETGVSGILIRSRIVSDWPELQVDISAGARPGEILRQEKLAPDLLLVLGKDSFSAVRLSLPSGTQRFEAGCEKCGPNPSEKHPGPCHYKVDLRKKDNLPSGPVEVAQAHRKVETAVEFRFKS